VICGDQGINDVANDFWDKDAMVAHFKTEISNKDY
jgi:hypothetical protein